MMQPQFETKPCTSCGRAMIWVISPNGSRLPLDARPVTVYSIVPDGDVLRAEKAERIDHSQVYISHFVTCPNAAQHSRGAAR